MNKIYSYKYSYENYYGYSNETYCWYENLLYHNQNNQNKLSNFDYLFIFIFTSLLSYCCLSICYNSNSYNSFESKENNKINNSDLEDDNHYISIKI